MLGAGIADFTFLKNRNSTVSFGDQILSSGIFHFTNRLKQLIGTNTAVGSIRRGWDILHELNELCRRNPHHGASCGIKRHGSRKRQPRFGSSVTGCLKFVEVGHRFNPDQIGSCFSESSGLLEESVFGIFH